MKRILNLRRAFAVLLIILLAVCGISAPAKTASPISAKELRAAEREVIYDECYDSAAAVAAYLHIFEELPPNFITKSEAAYWGWISAEGNLWEVLPGYSIGGDKFGNREGLLPKAKQRQYYECDINYSGGYRGAERIIYSNDGLIYYTGDHYKSFVMLYGEDRK